MQTQIHKIHHNSDLGEATTFPFIVFYVPGHRAINQMTFCLGLPSGSSEIPKIGTPATLESHNFVCKPPIKVSSKAKL